MKAYVEGIHYYKTHRQESLTVLAKYLKTNNTEALKEIHQDIGLALVPAKPYPTLKGIDAILREVDEKEPEVSARRDRLGHHRDQEATMPARLEAKGGPQMVVVLVKPPALFRDRASG